MKQAMFDDPGVIVKIEHDGDCLRVHYRSGGVYDYDDVSDELVKNMINSESPARFMIQRVMPDRRGVPVGAGDPFPRLDWA